MKQYVADYRHDGRAWIVQFRDQDISTFGRTLSAAKRYAREALAAYLEEPDLETAGVGVVDEVRLPAEVESDVERLASRRREAESMRRDVAIDTRRATRALRRVGLSTRDVGEILGVSAARVAQIEREAAT